jgi:FkbM family methyltransferase
MWFWDGFWFRRELAHLLRFVRVPVGKLSCDLWFEGPFKVSYMGTTFSLLSSREDKGTLDIFWSGLDKSWDATSIYLWGELARESKVIVDIGGSMGLYAMAAKVANPESEVYSFEPSRTAFEMLCKNIALNNLKIVAVPVALSNTKGEAEFYDLVSFTAISSLKLNENLRTSPGLIKYKVPVMTLADFVESKGISRIDLVSIDVEMNEPEVLEGMGDLIERFKPTFIVEVLRDDIGRQVQSYFEGKGYVYYSIVESSGICMTEALKAAAEGSGYNYLICSKATAERLKIAI